MRFLLFLFSVLIVQKAWTLNVSDRIQLHERMAAFAMTLGQKSIPVKIEKGMLEDLKGDDRARAKAALQSWTKFYNPQLNYVSSGTGMSFYYRQMPLLNLSVEKLKPLTFVINGKRKIEAKEGTFLQSLLEGLKAEGYALGVQQTAWNFILPQAFAEGENFMRSLENSVVMYSSWYETRYGTDDTKELARAGFLKPKSGLASLFKGDSELSCDGESARGKVKDANGTEILFTATRSEVELTFPSGNTIKGMTRENPNPFCLDYQDIGSQFDRQPLEDYISQADLEYRKRTYIEIYIVNKLTPQGESYRRACVDKKAQDFSQAKKIEAQELATIRTMGIQIKEVAPDEPTRARFQFDCETKWNELALKDAQKTAALTAEAEEAYRKEPSPLPTWYNPNRERIDWIRKDCERLKEVRPRAEVNCDSIRTIGDLKKVCSGIAKSKINLPDREWLSCSSGTTKNKTCRPVFFEPVAMSLGQAQHQLDEFADLAKLKEDFEARHELDVKSGILEEDEEGYRFREPGSLGKVELSRLQFELKEFAKKRKEILNRKSKADEGTRPTFAETLGGTLGLLDCCGDAECRTSLRDRGINLVPGPSKARGTK